jgi:hypothetical protein
VPPAVLPSPVRRWLLAAAVVFEIGWIVALTVLAVMR